MTKLIAALMLLLAAGCPSLADDAVSEAAPAPEALRNSSALVCFVVRTYWGHGPSYDDDLRIMLRSLQRQRHSRWEAVLLVADSRPFDELHALVSSLKDERIWVFAEWVSVKIFYICVLSCLIVVTWTQARLLSESSP
jgi:hypothetical protein